MRKFRSVHFFTVLILVLSMSFVLVACSGSDDETDPSMDTTGPTTQTTPITLDTTPTTTLHIFEGSLPENPVEQTWNQTELSSPQTKYIDVGTGFLRVRSGPGTDYDQVAALSRNMQIVVVAETDNGWFQMEDGYYVSGDYLSDTRV